MSRQAGSFRFSGVEHRSAGRTRPCSSTGLSPGHHTKEGGGPTAMRNGKTCGRLCVRPQRRVNCASHRSQAKAVLSTGTHCMCRQVLHRTFVPRTTVSDLLIAANKYDHGPKITTTDWQTRSAGDEEVTNLEARGFDGWDHRRRRALVCGCVVERCPHRLLPQRPTRVYRAALESGFTDGQWQAIKLRRF